MIREFLVQLDNNKINQYNYLLSRFSNWVENKREINISQLIDSGTKIEFEIEMENSNSVFYIQIDRDLAITDVSGFCAVINKLKFIILNNDIISLKLSTKILTSFYGKIVKDLIESDVEIKLYQNYNSSDQVTGFYLSIPDSVKLTNP
jgi:hypothetical protein